MTPAMVIQLVLGLAALYPTLEISFVKTLRDINDLFADGRVVTEADVLALITRGQAQSEMIQNQPD